MKQILHILFCLNTLWLTAQNEDVLSAPDSLPKFPGGNSKLVQFLVTNVYFPPEAREAGVSGKAYVQFIVDTLGKVTNPVILKSSGDKSLDKEALRVVSIMPNWEPALDKNRKVKAFMNLPIAFRNAGTLSHDPNQPKLTPEEQEKHEKAMSKWNEGHKLENKGKYKEALEKYQESLKQEANNKFALFDQAKMLLMLGQQSQACEIWRKMSESNLRKNESDEFVLRFCGSNGKEESLKYANEMQAMRFYSNAMDELNGGRYENAVVRFDSCLKYNPQHKAALYNKGFMHLQLSQKKAACASWKKLLEIDPNDKQTLESISKNCN